MGRIALVLGSGGARGYAHIGVIQVLEERGHEVAAVSGASMGALIGGLHVAGKLGEFTGWALGLKQFDVLRMMDLTVREPGLVRGDRITRHLSGLLDGIQIEDSPIPYTAVATDLGSRREVWFQQGPMDVAIRASIAMPSFITPVVVGDRLLIDGGVVNPLPIEPTLSTPVDATVAVELNGPSRADSRNKDIAISTPYHASADEVDQESTGRDWLERFRMGAVDLFAQTAWPQTAWARKNVDPARSNDLYRLGPAPKGLSYLDLVAQSVDMMGSMIARYRSASNPPDVAIQIPHDAARVSEFHRASGMITLGRKLANEALDRAGL